MNLLRPALQLALQAITRFALIALLASLGLLATQRSHAGTNTVEILGTTVAALPSCMRYEVKGVCFFLHCRTVIQDKVPVPICTIRTSVRIQHYVPDAIVSTYNEPALHPWVEVGRPLAVTLSGVGSVIAGAALDSSAATARTNPEQATFKSVDVIGNPVGLLAYLFAGGEMPELPKLFTIPGYSELLSFPANELPRIVSLWAGVPVHLGNELLEAARRLARLPGELIEKIMTLPAKVAQLATAVGKVQDVVGKGLDAVKIGTQIGKLIGIDLAPLKAAMQLINMANGGELGLEFSPGYGSFVCPGSASAFGLHFQSDLDGLFWRGIIPAEMLYPGAWIPGYEDVSTGSGLVHTWGSRYPRTGEVVQQHPVKASAVLAERAASIVKRPSQPHIYSRLEVQSGGFMYFEAQADPRWQMLYPSPRLSCEPFGSNDSVSLSAYGDGRTSPEDGYVWNLWQRYDCCLRMGRFLFTVP